MKGIRRGRPPIRGSHQLGPREPLEAGAPLEASAGTNTQAGARPLPKADAAKKRVLFVCIGNACRSQMAEAFAKAYGADVADARSAGLSPAPIIPPLTRKVLAGKNVSLDGHFPKGLETALERFDVLVNMSGVPLPIDAERVIQWSVLDPIGRDEATFNRVAAQIEDLVMRLIIELRSSQ
jgi:arsenate reductase